MQSKASTLDEEALFRWWRRIQADFDRETISVVPST